MKKLLAITLLSIALSACKSSQPPASGEVTDKIEYRFGDSSVPPQYHRSYTITVTEFLVKVVVDSYGEVLAEQEEWLGNGDFDGVMQALETSGLKACKRETNEGCTGGTSESVFVWRGGTQTLAGTVYHCGGTDSGTLCGDVHSVADKVKALVPNLADLLK